MKHTLALVSVPKGERRAKVLDDRDRIIEAFTAENCRPTIHADSTRLALTWTGADDLSAVAGRNVKFRFILSGGALYSFWVSPDATGASHGYVAAGGPGFVNAIDTTGKTD